jgi:hypothetical protein
MKRLESTSEPAVFAEARPRLKRQLEKAWQTKGSRGPVLDEMLYSDEVFDALVSMTGGTCAYCE